MSRQRDESLLTAYALGELDDVQRATVEAWIAESEEARAQLAEIRQSMAFLEEEFGAEPAAELTPEQRAAITAAAGRGPRSWGRWMYPVAGLAAAACLTVVVGLQLWEGEPSSFDNFSDEPIAATVEAPSAPAEVDSLEEFRAEATRDTVEAAQAVQATGAGDRDAAASTQPQRQLRADGSIRGTLIDEAGSVLPGVEVRLKNEATGRQNEKISSDDGKFDFADLEAGRYRLEAELTGFKRHEQEIVLAEKEQRELTPELEAGGVSETVVVVTKAARVRVESASMQPAHRAERTTTTLPNTLPSNGRRQIAVGQSREGAGSGLYVLEAGQARKVTGGLPTAPEPSDDANRNVRRQPDFNTENYDLIVDNPFIPVSQDPLSTFSIDVDTASYANVRRFLTNKQLPPPDAVRIEELVNYFTYSYAPPKGEQPFSTHIEVTAAPWKPEHRLLRVGLKGREIDMSNRPAGNFVFLLDVSGSMNQPDKLPLVKKAMRLLTDELGPQDRIAMVVYAGASGLVLPSTQCNEKSDILSALDRLRAGGSTNGGSGIQLAYKVAQDHFIKGGINRVILATDGDFNVGVTNEGELVRLIEEKAKSGVFLSVLGFGTGNIKDSTMEQLSNKGNGNYAYIDSLQEARKVLVEQAGGTLVTIAKDVKIQLEFNPARVNAFRLIGYENRVLAHQDFNDDTKDAGEIGAGHTVTALYEVVPAGVKIDLPTVDPLKYQPAAASKPAADASDELLTVKLRYKQPDGDTSQLIEVPVVDPGGSFEQASTDARFAASVAGFGMLLRDSPYKGGVNFEDVARWAEAAQGSDAGGYRAEFIKLVRAARALQELEGLKQ